MTAPRSHSCLSCESWLCQGDIFANAPVLDFPDLSDGRLLPQMRNGPAMLVTHDCDLDKMKAGKPKIERLAFVRLRNVEELPADRIELIRGSGEKTQPYEAMYLGQIPGIGESYVLVSDPYFVPVGYFKTSIVTYPGPQPNQHLTVTENDSRRFRLSDADLALFRTKWIINWTRLQPRQDEPS